MTTISEGWVAHEEPYATPPALTAINYFGLIVPGNTAILEANLNYTVKRQTEFGTYYPTEVTVGSKVADQIRLNYVPVNGLWVYWQMGDQDDATTTHGITTMDGSARKPHIALWQQTDNKKYHHYGAVIHDTTLNYSDDGSGFSVSQTGKGMSHGTDSNTPTKDYPTSIYSPFVNFDSMSWNSNDISPTKFSFNISHPIKGYIDTSGAYYQELNEFSPMAFAYNLQFNSADGETIYTDYLAGTERAVKWKITKADTDKYIECTQNCTIVSMIPTRSYGQNVIWSAVMQGEAPSFEIVDGIADSFYGIT